MPPTTSCLQTPLLLVLTLDKSLLEVQGGKPRPGSQVEVRREFTFKPGSVTAASYLKGHVKNYQSQSHHP